MKHLKQFLYLDEYKMYSLSSQLFQGLTDYLLKYGEAEKEDEENQKGPYGSGRSLTVTASDVQGQQERRILHDYAYTKFESELTKIEVLVECDASSSEETIAKMTPGALVKVRGYADFNDMKAIGDIVKQFNSFGHAITYLTTHQARMALNQEAEDQIKAEKDRNRKAKIKTIQKAATDINKLAENMGLHMEDKFLENLGVLLAFGYGEQFEVSILPYGYSSEKPFFSALLKRVCLREKETFITKKFSRQAPGAFSLVGIVCQGLAGEERPMPPKPDQPQHMREAIAVMVSALCEIDKGFFGRFNNEVILDPVALYQEIEIATKEDEI